MKYCSNCGHPVIRRIPSGDNLPRFVCEQCATVHYQNPKMVVGCIPEWEDRILLCRRAIEPRYGLDVFNFQSEVGGYQIGQFARFFDALQDSDDITGHLASQD